MRMMQATRAEQVKLLLKSSMSSGGIITINKVQTLLYSICRLNSWRALHPLEPRASFSLGGSKILQLFLSKRRQLFQRTTRKRKKFIQILCFAVTVKGWSIPFHGTRKKKRAQIWRWSPRVVPVLRASKSFGIKMVLPGRRVRFRFRFCSQINPMFCWLGPVVLGPTFWCSVSPNGKTRPPRQQNFLVQSTKSREICELIIHLACN